MKRRDTIHDQINFPALARFPISTSQRASVDAWRIIKPGLLMSITKGSIQYTQIIHDSNDKHPLDTIFVHKANYPCKN